MSSTLVRAVVTSSTRTTREGPVLVDLELPNGSFLPLPGSTIGVIVPDLERRQDVCAIRPDVVEDVQALLADRRGRARGRYLPASVQEETRLFMSVFMAIRNELRGTVSREVASRIAWQVVDEAAAPAGKE